MTNKSEKQEPSKSQKQEIKDRSEKRKLVKGQKQEAKANQ